MLRGIDHVVLNVADAEASLAWYVERFGVEPVRLEEWRAGKVPFVSFRIDAGLIVDLFETEITGTNADHVAYVCDRADFDAFVERYADDIEKGPMSLFGARGQGDGVYLRDLDGHRLELRTY